jgi:hypothetical protein
METVRMGKKFLAGFCVVVLLVMLQGCFKSDEQKAYEETVSSLSLQKFTSFFQKYPHSKYGELMVSEFSVACDVNPDSRGCYEMILKAIPKDSLQYDKVVDKVQEIK